MQGSSRTDTQLPLTLTQALTAQVSCPPDLWDLKGDYLFFALPETLLRVLAALLGTCGFQAAFSLHCSSGKC